MATEPRPLFYYPPSVEFLLRRSLREDLVPMGETDICAACGYAVGQHIDPGTNRYRSCEAVARHARQERES